MSNNILKGETLRTAHGLLCYKWNFLFHCEAKLSLASRKCSCILMCYFEGRQSFFYRIYVLHHQQKVANGFMVRKMKLRWAMDRWPKFGGHLTWALIRLLEWLTISPPLGWIFRACDVCCCTRPHTHRGTVLRLMLCHCHLERAPCFHSALSPQVMKPVLPLSFSFPLCSQCPWLFLGSTDSSVFLCLECPLSSWPLSCPVVEKFECVHETIQPLHPLLSFKVALGAGGLG